jgi:hypothetical protein
VNQEVGIPEEVESKLDYISPTHHPSSLPSRGGDQRLGGCSRKRKNAFAGGWFLCIAVGGGEVLKMRGKGFECWMFG